MNKRQKKKAPEMRNKRLIKEYPFLAVKTDFSGRSQKYDYEETWYDDIPYGWKKAFGKKMLKEMKDELIRCRFLHQYTIIEVKEKYGSLRIYDTGVPEDCAIPEIIAKYEDLSETVCIYCGKPEQKMIAYRGWWTCICRECFDRQEERKLKKGYIKEKLKYEDEPEIT